MVLQNQLLIDARIFAVHTFLVAQGSQLKQVLIALFILSQQHLMIAFVFLVLGEVFFMPVLYYVKLAAYYRLYLQRSVFVFMFVRLGNKFKRTKHVSMIGNGQRGHAILDSLLIKTFYRSSTIEEAKLSMNV